MSEKEGVSGQEPKSGRISRRRMVAGAAALSFSIIRPELVRGAAANSKVRVGVIGCGGRGTMISKFFQKHGGFQLVGAADYFPHKADKLGEALGIKPSNRHTTLSGYRKLLDKGVDAVIVTSPPFFHPEHAAAAVDAGCHVYIAKPIAVDAPGCLAVAETGKKATAAKQCFLVDFQTRANPFYREAVKRAQFGDIGRIVCGEVNYQTGRLRPRSEAGPGEARLANWVFDKALSGDIITEQNIHVLDVACWILDQDPVQAFGGAGGRKARTDVGDCWDHFAVGYRFPDDVIINFSSNQFCKGYGDLGCRIYGTLGTIDTHYGGEVTVRGDAPYKGGPTKTIYRDGAMANVTTFHENITKGRFANPTVAPSVRSNLVTILGRTAAYEGREVAWKEIMASKERIDGKLQGLKS